MFARATLIASMAALATASFATGAHRASTEAELIARATPAMRQAYASCQEGPSIEGAMTDCRALLIPNSKPTAAAKPAKAAAGAQREPNYFGEGCEFGCALLAP